MSWTGIEIATVGTLITAADWNRFTANYELVRLNRPGDAAWVSFQTPTELTVSGGGVEVTRNIHTIDTEGDASTDNLDNLTFGVGVVEGHSLALLSENSGRDTTIRSGTGNITLGGGANFTLGTAGQSLLWLYARTDSQWSELSRSA